MSMATRVTVADAARILDRSTEQVRRYLREGVLAGERIGNQWFIDYRDLEQMLRQRERGDRLADQIGAAGRDPLREVIGIGASAGAGISRGPAAYLQALTTTGEV